MVFIIVLIVGAAAGQWSVPRFPSCRSFPEYTPQRQQKAIGLPMNRASAEETGNSGWKWAIGSW
jgi:hypothetical protein